MGKKAKIIFTSCLFLAISLLIFSLPAQANGIETLISTHDNGFYHQFPKIYNDKIVWQDEKSPYGIIYAYDLSSGIETQVTDNTSYATNPSIYGDYIVYTDCGPDPGCFSNSAIYLFNLATGTRTQVSLGASSQDVPSIFNNKIVWQDYDQNPSSQIYVNGTLPGDETRVNASDSNQFNPAIYGNSVVWEDDRDGNNNIFLADLVSHEVTRITDNTGGQQNPAIFAERIVWQDDRNGNYEIYTNGTIPGNDYSLTPNEPTISHMNPAISGDWVVWWQDNTTTGNYDIVVNDTSTNQKIQIALNRSVIPSPAIFYSVDEPHYRVVWDQMDPGGNSNIYLYSSSSPGTCPVAGFTHNFAGGGAPVAVHFTDTSSQSLSNPISHWFWDFGDGSNSTLENPDHTYTANQVYDVSLTVGNPYCRNAMTIIDSVVVGKPRADFTASPTNDIVPVTVTFTDTSPGNPTQWNWSFGDGIWTNGTTQNPTHTYSTPGTYTVSLIASNGYGSTTKTRNSYITVLSGANESATTSINGITLQSVAGRQYLVFNYATLPAWSFNPNTSSLEFTPPADKGFGNISVFTSDPGGFLVNPGNSTILGNISSVRLESKNIVPTGFSAATGGPFASVNYTVTLSSYPESALLSTKVWEGATSTDASLFNYIATASHYSGTNGTAYTTKIVKTNFPTGGTAHLHMSLNASWVASKPLGRNEVYLERISDDGLYGQILPTTFLFHNSSENLDYFEADSPSGLSTFGLSFVEGSGNPLQILALTVTSHINDANTAGSGDSAKLTGTVTPTLSEQPSLTITPQLFLDPGKTANLYINTKTGAVTQTTTLVSTDNRTTLTLGEGIIAKDRQGNILPSITIKNLPPSSIPAVPTELSGAFSGIAFDLGPDGATFSPAATLAISFPEAHWNTEYSLKGFDHVTKTWIDLPTVYSPKNSTITSSVSHFCCFALFSVTTAPTDASKTKSGVIVAPSASPGVQSPPTTAINIFINMIVWAVQLVTKYLIVFILAGLAILLLYYIRRKKRMDRIRFMR